MQRKITEAVKFVTTHFPGQYTGTSGTACYGQAVDTLGFDGAAFHFAARDIPHNNTIDVAICENSVNNPATSVAVTGASFTQFGATSDNTQQVGDVLCRNTKRYLWARMTPGGGGGNPTIGIGGFAALFGADSEPVSQAVAFDVDNLDG